MFPLLHPYTIHLPLNTLFSSQKIYQIPHSVLWWIRFLNTVLQGYARKWHCLGFLVQSNRKTRGSTVLAGKQGKQVQKMNRVVRSLDGQDNRPDPAGGWGHPSCPTGREVHGSKSSVQPDNDWVRCRQGAPSATKQSHSMLLPPSSIDRLLRLRSSEILSLPWRLHSLVGWCWFL